MPYNVVDQRGSYPSTLALMAMRAVVINLKPREHAYIERYCMTSVFPVPGGPCVIIDFVLVVVAGPN